jgi:2-aminobenzoate-CoA ligase
LPKGTIPSSDLPWLFMNIQTDFSDLSNCVDRLLDIHIRRTRRFSLMNSNFWNQSTFQDLYENQSRVHMFWVDDLGFVRIVLIRSAVNPMLLLFGLQFKSRWKLASFNDAFIAWKVLTMIGNYLEISTLLQVVCRWIKCSSIFFFLKSVTTFN